MTSESWQSKAEAIAERVGGQFEVIPQEDPDKVAVLIQTDDGGVEVYGSADDLEPACRELVDLAEKRGIGVE